MSPAPAPAPADAVEWRPCGLLSGHVTKPYAVVILNQAVNRNALDAVIDQAKFLVCADGGADRLREYEAGNRKNDSKHSGRLPDVIVGDLDSLTAETADYYRARQVKIVRQPDQYSTDFTKALRWIRQEAVAMAVAQKEKEKEKKEKEKEEKEKEEKEKEEARRPSLDGAADGHLLPVELDVVVLGGLGGRVDQGFSQIHHLYVASRDEQLLRGRIYLLSEQSLSFVLDAAGQNVIHIEPGYFEENVGIIPVRGQATISLKGFEWDVHNWPTEFGSQMSTSNHIRSDVLEVSFQGAAPLFTLELAARFQAGHHPQ